MVFVKMLIQRIFFNYLSIILNDAKTVRHVLKTHCNSITKTTVMLNGLDKI